jgi:hypothetical protein
VVEFLPRLTVADRAALGSALRTFALEGRSLDEAALPAFSLDRERARQALVGVADELRTYPPIRGVPSPRRP